MPKGCWYVIRQWDGVAVAQSKCQDEAESVAEAMGPLFQVESSSAGASWLRWDDQLNAASADVAATERALYECPEELSGDQIDREVALRHLTHFDYLRARRYLSLLRGGDRADPQPENRQLSPRTVTADTAAVERAGERVAPKALEAIERRDAHGIGGTDTDWKDVQGRLLAKRERGEPYTRLRKLSVELKCSDATIRKAIDESETLRGWRVRSMRPKAAPRATDLGAVDRNHTRQTAKPTTDDVLPDDDVDATMAKLIDRAGPDERAKLNALDDTGRRALVATYQSQKRDNEPSPLIPDTPGERPQVVKQHKRA